MKKKMKQYGKKVVFVNHYSQAPDDARFILRGLDDGTARFELYQDNTQFVLWDTDYGALDNETSFDETLKKCRLIAGASAVIYVEAQSWMFTEEELEEFFESL